MEQPRFIASRDYNRKDIILVADALIGMPSSTTEKHAKQTAQAFVADENVKLTLDRTWAGFKNNVPVLFYQFLATPITENN